MADNNKGTNEGSSDDSENMKGSEENKEQKKRFKELEATVAQLSTKNEELKDNLVKRESENKVNVELEMEKLKWQNDIESLRRELEESRKRVLEGMKGRQREKDTKLEALREKDAKIEALKREMKEKDEKIEGLKREMKETDAKIEALKREMNEKPEALRDKDAKIEALKREMNEKLEAPREINEMLEALREKDAEIKALLAVKESSGDTSLSNQREAKEQEISSLKKRGVNLTELGLFGASALAVVAAAIGIVRYSNAGKKN